MKKMTALLLALLAVCVLTACAGEGSPSGAVTTPNTANPSSETVSGFASSAASEPAPAPQPTPVKEPADETTPGPGADTKVLVAYFSATGNTRPLAEYLAEGLSADLYEIVPEEPYTDADLNYSDSGSRSSVEMNDPNSRPAVSDPVENMEQYGIVFVGYPIWWGQAPRIISTFLESYDWSGKTIIPFCTSGSSPIGSSAVSLESLTAGADWLPGQRFSSGTNQEELLSWVDGLDLPLTAE